MAKLKLEHYLCAKDCDCILCTARRVVWHRQQDVIDELREELKKANKGNQSLRKIYNYACKGNKIRDEKLKRIEELHYSVIDRILDLANESKGKRDD